MADSIGKGFPRNNLQIGHTFCDIDDGTLWKYIGGPTNLVSSWVLIGGQLSEQPDTTLWGANQAGATWFYVPERTYYGWDGSQLVSMAFGTGMTLYNYKITFSSQDDFLTGSQSSGSIGSLSWLSAGTITVQGSNGSYIGRYQLDTGAVSGTMARITFASSANFASTKIHNMLWSVQFGSIDANTTIRIGAVNGISANPPDFGIFFEKLDADTTLFCVARTSAVETRVNSGHTLIANNTVILSYKRFLDRVEYYINGQLVATITTNVPSALISPIASIINSAAAAKTIIVDYFEMTSEVTR
jgi:hypothetical protein